MRSRLTAIRFNSGMQRVLTVERSWVELLVYPPEEINLPAVVDCELDNTGSITKIDIVHHLNLPPVAKVFEEEYQAGYPFIIGQVEKITPRAYREYIAGEWVTKLAYTVTFKAGAYRSGGEYWEGHRVPLVVGTGGYIDPSGVLEIEEARGYTWGLAVLSPTFRLARLYNLTPALYQQLQAQPAQVRLGKVLGHLLGRQ